MIFLTLIAAGALTGAAIHWSRSLPLGAAPRFGAGGAFLLGGLAAGIASGTPGPLDPVVLAAGVGGAIAAVLLLARLRGQTGRSATRGEGPRVRSSGGL